MTYKNVTHVNHPLIQHKLTLMRDKNTASAVFRQLLREISTLLTYEVLRDIPLTTQTIQTPMEEMEAPVLEGKKLAFISILRAGNGLLDGMLDLVPSARVILHQLRLLSLRKRARIIFVSCLCLPRLKELKRLQLRTQMFQSSQRRLTVISTSLATLCQVSVMQAIACMARSRCA